MDSLQASEQLPTGGSRGTAGPSSCMLSTRLPPIPFLVISMVQNTAAPSEGLHDPRMQAEPARAGLQQLEAACRAQAAGQGLSESARCREHAHTAPARARPPTLVTPLRSEIAPIPASNPLAVKTSRFGDTGNSSAGTAPAAGLVPRAARLPLAPSEPASSDPSSEASPRPVPDTCAARPVCIPQLPWGAQYPLAVMIT